LIGRQVYTDFGKSLDLLAIDVTGSLIVVELKKHKTPRDVVAQTIDYASWVEGLSPDRVVKIYQQFVEKYGLAESNFDQAFKAKFGYLPAEEDVNSSHQMVVVAAELDGSTERIITYLNDKAKIAVNAVFFSVFEDGGNCYLSRAWMIDLGETEERAINIGQKEEWNGEYYASFGASTEGRSWADARKYGFISAGGGRWYSKTLFMLSPGDRVWVNIPKTGYVGVAKVIGNAIAVDDFKTKELELLGSCGSVEEWGKDDAEYMVPVEWVYSVDERDAVNEVGLFGNQNSVARPRTSKWRHTVDRLKSGWDIKG